MPKGLPQRANIEANNVTRSICCYFEPFWREPKIRRLLRRRQSGLYDDNEDKVDNAENVDNVDNVDSTTYPICSKKYIDDLPLEIDASRHFQTSKMISEPVLIFLYKYYFH